MLITFPRPDGEAYANLDNASDFSQKSQSTMDNTERPFHLLHGHGNSPRYPKL